MNERHGHGGGRCLRAGSCIVVKGINASHPSARKLMAMGFGRGCEVKVERVAPFGDPCIVRLRGYNLAVRRRDFDALEAEEKADAEE